MRRASAVFHLVLLVATSSALSPRPHIVSIIADDMGWNDVGFHGSNQIPTPNIDALAYNGVILNRHYTMPTCTPSRTAYLTGKYPIRTGMQGYPLKAGEPRGLPLEEVTLPQRLRELGYVTRMIGKWHQGSHRTEYAPTQRGFDSFLGYWNGYISYFNYTLIERGTKGRDFHRDNCGTSEFDGHYATDVFTDEAVDIINKHDLERPLYLHLAHLAVHAGNDDNPLEVPDVDEAHRKFSYIQTPERRLYAEMVSKLDESVGRVVTALSERGVLNNTILLFISDNGAQTVGMHSNWGSNWPLRGMKFTLFEGGVRCSAAVWSPMLEHPGRVTTQMFHLTDWLPTLYSAAGGNVSDLGLLDGVDQWSSLTSKTVDLNDPRKQILLNINEAEEMEALIDRGWKLSRGDYNNGVYDGFYGEDGHGLENPSYNITQILNSAVNQALKNTYLNEQQFVLDENLILDLRLQSEVKCNSNTSENKQKSGIACLKNCLFDIINDPCEKNDVASTYPEKVQELSVIMDSFRKVTVPQLNKPIDPASNPALHNGSWVSWLDDPLSDIHQCTVKIPVKMHNVASIEGYSLIPVVLLSLMFVFGIYWPTNLFYR